jgi:hypothetical protein
MCPNIPISVRRKGYPKLILCDTTNMSYSPKYWKTLFKPIEKIYRVKLIFRKNNFNGKLKMKELRLWAKSSYPNDKVVYLVGNRFQIGYNAFKGYANDPICLVEIQPKLRVPRSCCSDKTILVPWYRATLAICIHEIAHLYGLEHCSNRKCIMGIVRCEGKIRHCWRCISRLSCYPRSKIFCKECFDKLRKIPS